MLIYWVENRNLYNLSQNYRPLRKIRVPRPLDSISEKVMKSVWAVLEKVVELK